MRTACFENRVGKGTALAVPPRAGIRAPLAAGGETPDRAVPSREAAKECSPRRKPWVTRGNRASPGRAKEKLRLSDARGSALLEFAITLPLLVVFVVGIYDFSGGFNQKQKIEQAAQEGAIIAGAQPMSDIATTTSDPDSLHPVVSRGFQLASRQWSGAQRNLHPTGYGIRTGWPGVDLHNFRVFQRLFRPTLWSLKSIVAGSRRLATPRRPSAPGSL